MRPDYWVFRLIVRVVVINLVAFALLTPLASALGQWSPGGGVLTFSTPTIENSEWAIMLLDSRLRIALPVATYPWRLALAPVWSPDGTRFAYATLRPQSDIFVHDVYSGTTINLTNDYAEDRYPTWSPDGRHLLYYSNLGSAADHFDIYRVEVESARRHRMTTNEAVQPAFSPDGAHILFSGSAKRDIHLMRADGSGQRPLTRSPRNEYNGVWSPNGAQFAFVGFVNSPPYVGKYIFLMDSACAGLGGGPGADCADQPRILLPDFRSQGMPQWSPDGRFLAFIGRQKGDTTDTLYVMDMTTMALRRLAVQVFYAYVERWPMWSPDSRHIAYSQRGLPGLYMVEVATGAVQQLSAMESVYPVWQP